MTVDGRGMETEGGRRVRRRRVFYIPGYDPFPPRRYREIYRREGAEQARISGYGLRMLPRGPGSRFGWKVEGRIEGAEVHAAHEVLVWSDIVQGSMGGGVLATYGQLTRTAWIYIASGALLRLVWLRKGPTVAALYPVGVLLAQLLVALAAAAGLGIGVERFAQAFLPLAAGPVGVAFGLIGGAGLAWAILDRCRRADHRIYAWYLMHDFAFTARWGGAYPAPLETRLAAFGAQIAAALAEDWDEVLVVGHSSGAHLGVSILADLARQGRLPRPDEAGRPVLSFLSLGQVVPMVSYLPRADRLRADLALLSVAPDLTWVDVTAPGDGCAFALCDPVAVTGVAPPDQRWPLILSAAFSQTISPGRWQRIKRQFFRLHFQYLCAFDNLPGQSDDYDYFRLTAGPLTLAERLGGRAHSRGRVTRALNGHRRMA